MSFLRDLRSDLVEKRLWPLALLLVAALVGVPLVLAKSPKAATGPAEPAPTAPAAAAPPVAGVPAVSVVTTTTGGAPLRGHAKDPFRQQHVPPKPKTATAGATSPAGGGGSTAPASGTSPKRKKVYLVAHVTVRFGKAGGTLQTIDDVPRLAPLPSAANPVVVFLGMRADEKTAAFLVSSDEHLHGAGRCVPSRSDCEEIELKADDVGLLDVTGAHGKVTSYELDLVKVTLQHTTSKTKAQAAYARASRAGRRLLRRQAATSAVASGLRYSTSLGVLAAVPGATFLSRLGAEAGAPQAVAGVRREGWVTPIP